MTWFSTLQRRVAPTPASLTFTLGLTIGVVLLEVALFGPHNVHHFVKDLLLNQPVILAESPQRWLSTLL